MKQIITKEMIESCKGMTRNQAAGKLNISVGNLWHLTKKHNLEGIYKNLKKPPLTTDMLLSCIGMNGYAASKKLGYRPPATYDAIRRCGLHKEFGIVKYSSTFQGEV